MRIELLKWLVASALANVGPQYPYGYCYAPKEQLTGCNELMSEGLVTAYPSNAQPDGSFPVAPTAKGVEAVNTPQTAPQPNPAPTQATAMPNGPVKLESGIPMPEAARRGFQSREGGNAIDRYGFDNMVIGQSFHLPPSGDPDKAKATHRTFSSTVSQANAKLYPKAFAVREVGANDPAGPGARVWRIADMTGPRPTRKPRAKPEAAPAPQAAPQGWPAPAPAAPVDTGFGGQGAFPAPGGFPAPQAAPQGFGGGFPENMPPAGFGTGGPSFGG